MTRGDSTRNPSARSRTGGSPDGSDIAATLAGRALPRIGFGASPIGRAGVDRADAVALVRRALELGVRHFDTAEFYGAGSASRVLREVVSGTDAFVASKIGAAPAAGRVPLAPAQHPHELREQTEANLRTLGLESIPLMYLRRLEVRPGMIAAGDQIVDLDDQLATMIELRDEGKIGAIGLSGIGLDTLHRALPAGIAAVQNSYSVVERAHESMLHLAERNGIVWAPFFPLGGSFPGVPKVAESAAVRAIAERMGATPRQVGLAWLLAHSPSTTVLPGTTRIRHLEENVAAGDLALDADGLALLDAVARPDAAPVGWTLATEAASGQPHP